MSERKRFSKTVALEVLDARAAALVKRFNFNRSNGTAQLEPKGHEFDAAIERAVAYGQMRAYESFAEAICEGFTFEDSATPKGEAGEMEAAKGDATPLPTNPQQEKQ